MLLAWVDTSESLLALENASPMPSKPPAPIPVAVAFTSIASTALRIMSPVVVTTVCEPKRTLALPLFSEVAETPVEPISIPPAPAIAELETDAPLAPNTADTLTDWPVKVSEPKLLTATSESTVDLAIETPRATPEATDTPKASLLALGLLLAVIPSWPCCAFRLAPLAKRTSTEPLSLAVAPAPLPETTPAEPPLAKAVTDASRCAATATPCPVMLPPTCVSTLPL